MSIGKSRLGRQSPYQLGLSAPAPAEELDHRQVDAHVRVGHADLHERAGEVAGEERLLEHLRVADRLDADVGAVAVGERPDGLDGVVLGGVDGVGGAELLGPARASAASRSTAMTVRGAGQPGAGDGGVADAAAAEHGDACRRARPRR